MKASSHVGESDMREIRRNGGATGGPRRDGYRAAVASSPRPRWRIAYFKPASCTDHFAKPAVMQGVPMPTRGRSHVAGRKSGTRRSGAAARVAFTRSSDSSEVSQSVVSVSLLERWNCVAQVYTYSGNILH